MKQMILSLAIVMAISVAARDRLYIENFDIAAGQTLEMQILLENDTVYCAFQTDLFLPDGLEVVTEDGEYLVDLTGRKDRTHTLSCNLLPDGAIRIFVTSMSVRPFSGNSGAIAFAEIRATNEYTGGGVVMLRNSVVVEENGLKHHLDDCTAYLNGSSPSVRGDVNGDGLVDVDDVNATINLILLYDQYRDKYPGSSDLDGNGMVDVDDVNVLINIILGR